MTRSRARVWSPALLLLLAAGCSIREAACGKPLEKPTVLSESEQAAAKGEDLPRVAIAVLGDSLTAGFGLLQAEAFPALLQEKFDAVEWIGGSLNGVAFSCEHGPPTPGRPHRCAPRPGRRRRA